MPSEEPSAVLVLFHGAHKLSTSTLPQKFLDSISDFTGNNNVEYGFLSLGFEPNYRKTTSRLIDMGIKKVYIWPIFLLPGKHLDEDIPKIVTELENKYQGVIVKLLRAPSIVDDLSQALGTQLKKELNI